MSSHKTVLKTETIDLLPLVKEGNYLDLTLGRAGHSLELASRLDEFHLYAFDLDLEAIEESKELFKGKRVTTHFYHDNFANAYERLSDLKGQIHGIIADLGVSSPQFDEGGRGFSYRYDAPLDMRMNLESSLTAKDIVNSYKEEELYHLLKNYGEEIDARAIANAIVRARETKVIETTYELVDIIKAAKPIKHLMGKGHPAKQTFQALRIEVNGELASLEKMLIEVPHLLAPKGAMGVISFHSLEDRLVKNAFRELAVSEGSRVSLEIEEKDFTILTKKPILPSKEEMLENPRSKSAKLRGLERKSL